MRKYSFILVVVFLHVYSNSIAQDGITFTRYTFSSITSFLGDSVELSATLKNTDTTIFQGSIDFGAKLYNQQQAIQISAFQSVTLNPNDSLPFTIKIPITPVLFQSGPNVVIIWPIMNKPNRDSIIQTFYIRYKTDISDIKQLNVHLKWLTKSILTLEGDEINSVKQVRILDLLGKENGVQTYQYQESKINLDFLTNGVYLLEVIGDDNKRKVIRFAYYP